MHNSHQRDETIPWPHATDATPGRRDSVYTAGPEGKSTDRGQMRGDRGLAGEWVLMGTG